MAKDSYAEKERLLKLKHHLELEKLAARREKARLSTTGILGQMIVNLGPDPLDVEAAELKEKQNNELIALVEERMASAGHVPKGKTQSAPESIRANAETFAPESHLKVERQESIPEIRKALLAAYKSNAREKGIRITDVMVAKAANPGKWNDRTMVTWWKRNDPRCKQPHDRKIRAVLARDPCSVWPTK